MVVWHVTTLKKLMRYLQIGYILPPVRAWTDVKAAEEFSKKTGRQIILRLKFPDSARKLKGHKGQAVVLNEPYPIAEWLKSKKPLWRER